MFAPKIRCIYIRHLYPYGQKGEQLEMHQISVNNWVRRFLAEGFNGLETRPGRGRKPIIGTHIPSQRGARLNCFAMIDRNCRTHWFTTANSIEADTMIGFLDSFSLTVKRKTVSVLDNAPIHWAKKLIALRGLWEKRGLHLFFLPPYSPQLNIAEILWRMLKGKWLQPRDYLTADTLFYAANRALATMGDGLVINFKYHVA